MDIGLVEEAILNGKRGLREKICQLCCEEVKGKRVRGYVDCVVRRRKMKRVDVDSGVEEEKSGVKEKNEKKLPLTQRQQTRVLLIDINNVRQFKRMFASM